MVRILHYDHAWVYIIQFLCLLLSKEVQKAEYVAVLEKMIAMYQSAILFHTNLKSKNIPGIDGNVTHYEITAIGDLEFEKDFTLRISEKLSNIENFTINGTYACNFVDNARGMHGEYVSDYTYRVRNDDITLTHSHVSAVM